MWALEAPFVARSGSVLASTPLRPLAALAIGWLVVGGLTVVGWLGPPALRIASITAAHGALLATALAWGAADAGVRLPRGTVVVTIGLVAAGAAAAAVDRRAALVQLAAPAWLAVLAFRRRLDGLGLAPPVAVRAVAVGMAIGALLGAHLLLSASQTLGYPLRGGAAVVLGLWAYDIGANVLSAECFFRGALFNRLQRRWSFGAAAAAATGAALVRYLCDPLLPGQIEVMAGALFYLTLLGAVDCWLLWWSGSLVPGFCASCVFFLAYRNLSIG
jgi:hypothetical protein